MFEYLCSFRATNAQNNLRKLKTMKNYNEVQEQIEKLEQVIVGLKKELTLNNSSFMSDKIKRQISMLESDIETLKWVVS